MLDELDDGTFLARFESALLPKEEFDHRSHLRAAFLMLRRDGLRWGPERFSQALQRYVRVHRVAQKFSAELTQRWLGLLIAAMEAAPRARTLDELLAGAPELADSRRVRPVDEPGA